MRLRPIFSLAVVALASLMLVLFGPVAHDAGARPGGGQNYRAPSRAPSYRPSPSPSYRSSPSPSYRSSPSRTYVPVPVPIPSGSGSSYGSSSSSYSNDSRPSGGNVIVGLIFFLVLLVGFLLIVYFIVRKFRGGGRAGVAVDQGAQARGLAALRAQDPGFDPAAFGSRVQATMAKLNDAWAKGQMGPARRLISDGVYVRFQTQLTLIAQSGLRNVMADWKAVSAEVLAAEADAQWDTVHVKIVGEARDLDVPANLDAAQVERKLKAAPLSQYQEVWSFLRRRGKKTKEGVPALEGRCPSCGADLPVSDVVQCEFCKALVNSGEHDWVLAEITQPEEWSVRDAESEVPGLAELRERDPHVSRQELEDRASVIFWKWVEARATDKRGRLARFCVAPITDDGGAALQELMLYPVKLAQVAVGSSDVRHITPGDPADPTAMDLAVVEIRWSASANGAPPEGTVNLLLLAKKSGATQKKAGGGLSSLDCPACRGPLAESDAVVCPFCGEQLVGGAHEWALQAVQVGQAPVAEDDSGGDDGSYE